MARTSGRLLKRTYISSSVTPTVGRVPNRVVCGALRVLGGLVADTDEGKARIRFVTEGEASMHACILSGLAADVLAVCSIHLRMIRVFDILTCDCRPGMGL